MTRVPVPVRCGIIAKRKSWLRPKRSGALSAATPNDLRGCIALGITFAGQPSRQQEAKAQFEQCLKLDPTNVEPKYQLGLIYKSEGEVTKAIRMFEEVIAQNTKHANALRDLGALYLQTGAEVKARAVLEQAAALNSEDAETHFLLSRLYNLIGESDTGATTSRQIPKAKGPTGEAISTMKMRQFISAVVLFIVCNFGGAAVARKTIMIVSREKFRNCLM